VKKDTKKAQKTILVKMKMGTYDIPYLRWSLHGAKVIEENSN